MLIGGLSKLLIPSFTNQRQFQVDGLHFFPWRWLMGHEAEGNQFWELKNPDD